MNQKSSANLTPFVGCIFIVIGCMLGYHALLPDGVRSDLVGSFGSVIFGVWIVLRKKMNPVRSWFLLSTSALCSVFHLMGLLSK
ncbi:hypothetical protein Hgul01_03436 [Herpetosiphon gulosus]|uniref:Uncharacterized protein n=1 Tax=Herpetosiphon gulosus TaxID=1973496 RepID=A0ABP9X2S0_9CHLR